MMKLSDHYSDTPLSSICELKNQTLWFFHKLCLHNYKFIFLRDLNVIVSKLFFDIHPFLICEFKQKKQTKIKLQALCYISKFCLHISCLSSLRIRTLWRYSIISHLWFKITSVLICQSHLYTHFYDSLFEHCFLPISLWVLSAVPVTSPGSAGHGLRWSLQILMVLSSDRVANYQFMLKLKTSIYKSISHSFYKK